MRPILKLELAAASVWQSDLGIRKKVEGFQIVLSQAEKYRKVLTSWSKDQKSDPWSERLAKRATDHLDKLIEDLHWMIKECQGSAQPMMQLASGLAGKSHSTQKEVPS